MIIFAAGKARASADLGLGALNVSAAAKASTIKAGTISEDGFTTVAYEGPSAGIDVGVKSGVKDSGISAMAELSAAKATKTVGPLYTEANLNANTGVKIGKKGFKLNFLGFGATLGVGGKFTLDTPVGSVGSCNPETIKNEIDKDYTGRYDNRRNRREEEGFY